MRLMNKVAIITGAGSGMGRESALLFAREGAKVVVADINDNAASETVNLIKENSGEACAVKVDVTKEHEVEAMVKTAIDKYSKLDILFNNAGFAGKADFVGLSESEWDQIISINLTGVFLGAKYAIPEMRRNGSGSIISTSSGAGIVGSQGRPAYSAAKGGVVLLSKSLALAVANDNIRVNAVCPGPTDTPMLSEFTGGVEATEKAYLAGIPMGRFVKPQEVANAALFLASDESSFITGIALPVDGGFLAK